MAISIQTPKEIADAVVGEVESELALTSPIPSKSFTRVVAKAFGGALALLHNYANFWAQQIFVRTASNRRVEVNGTSFVPLVEHGLAEGIGEPHAATAAELRLTVNVVTQGGNILAGRLFQGPNGYAYAAKNTVALNAAQVSVDVVAKGDPQKLGGIGAAGNLAVGSVLTFVQSSDDVQKEATVSAVLVTAADQESTSDYRNRVLSRRQRPPQGGSLADYRDWALGVTGIVSAYPYSTAPRSMLVRVRATAASSGDPDGVPTQAQLDVVEAAIRFDGSGQASRMPPDVHLTVEAVEFRDVEVTVLGLNVSDPTVVEAQLEAAIKSVLNTHQPYIRGLSTERRDRISRSSIEAAVQRVIAANNGTHEGVMARVATPVTGSVDVAITEALGEWTIRKSDNVTEHLGNRRFCELADAGSGEAWNVYLFRAVAIPVGATITQARVAFVAAATHLVPHDGIHIKAVDSVTPFVYAAGSDVTTGGEPRTAAVVEWSPEPWAIGFPFSTPDLSAVVQEVVDRGDWAGAHHIKLVLDDDDAGQERHAVSYGTDATHAARLHVEYTTPGQLSPFEVFELGPGMLPRLSEVVYK